MSKQIKEQIEFKAKNVQAFTTWLKRFDSISGSGSNTPLLLEIDNSTHEFLAKTYNEEKSVVKFSRIKFEEAGFELETKTVPSVRIKAGLYSIAPLIKTLLHFSEEFSVIFKYEEIKEDTNSSFAVTSVLIKSESLKVGFECSSLKIFNYLADETFKNIICRLDEKVSFDLKKEDMIKIGSLVTLDKDHKNMEFVNKSSKVYVKSKSFELLIGVGNKEEVKLPFLKAQFDKIDVENYRVAIGEDRMILTSQDSATVTVISMLEENEYDEKDADL